MKNRLNLPKTPVDDNVLLHAADQVERFLDSHGLERMIWAVLALAVIYFGPVIFIIINR